MEKKNLTPTTLVEGKILVNYISSREIVVSVNLGRFVGRIEVREGTPTLLISGDIAAIGEAALTVLSQYVLTYWEKEVEVTKTSFKEGRPIQAIRMAGWKFEVSLYRAGSDIFVDGGPGVSVTPTKDGGKTLRGEGRNPLHLSPETLESLRGGLLSAADSEAKKLAAEREKRERRLAPLRAEAAARALAEGKRRERLIQRTQQGMVRAGKVEEAKYLLAKSRMAKKVS